jgi:hypothetical protein
LEAELEAADLEFLEHDLSHLNAIGDRVHDGLGHHEGFVFH